MNDRYEPSPHFVTRVMREVQAYERRRAGLAIGWLRCLAAGGALAGILRAVPVF